MDITYFITSTMAIITPTAAIVATALGFWNLYATQLRREKIAARIGPSIEILGEGGQQPSLLAIDVPVAFVNLGARAGTVVDVAVVVDRTDSTAEGGHLMAWREFGSVDPQKGKWGYEGVSALTVGGRSSTTRHVIFRWDRTFGEPLVLRAGYYNLRLFVWCDTDSRPRTWTHQIVIETGHIASLNKGSSRGHTLWLRIAGLKEVCKLLNAHEMVYTLKTSKKGR